LVVVMGLYSCAHSSGPMYRVLYEAAATKGQGTT